MARIAGVDIPSGKRVEIAVRHIYGIGPKKAKMIVETAKIDNSKRVKDLSDSELGKIKEIIENSGLQVEGALRKEIKLNLDRLMHIRSYRGEMHRKGLPVRGQRTKTNARTRKGPAKIAVKKKAKPGKK